MEELAPFVSTTQLLASYLHTKGYPGTLYTRSVRGSKDGRLSDTEKNYHTFAMSHLRVSNSEAVSCEITSYMYSCAKTINLFARNNYS